MNAAIPGILRHLLLVVLVALLCGCNKDDSARKIGKSLEIRLANPPEVSSYISSMVEEFNLQLPSLPDGTSIRIVSDVQPTLNAAKKIADGSLKTHAWLASSSSLVNYVNSHRKNLGPNQINCEQLFATPIVIATQSRRLPQFKATGREISWAEAIDPDMSGNSENPDEKHLLFSHTIPTNSATGLAALIQLAYLATNKEGTLETADLQIPRKFDKLKQYESMIATYGFNELISLSTLAKSKGDKVQFTITSEQQLAVFNQRIAHTLQPLVALYPKEGSYWMDYTLCVSDADWVTPAHRAAIQMFTQFLSTPTAQRIVLGRGFRPSVASLPSEEPLTKDLGIDVSKGTKTLLPISGDLVELLIERWPELRRPNALLLILDTSSSMEGAALRLGKKQFRDILAASSWKDLKSLMSFSTSPKVERDFSLDAGEVIAILDGLVARGGSAVYDSLKKALEIMLRSDLNNYRRTIILFTDGDDKNSSVNLRTLVSLFEESLKRFNLNLFIVAVGHDQNFNDLAQIADAADGVFRQGGLDDLDQIFLEILSAL